MKCSNCDKLAMFTVGDDGTIPLCLDCYAKYQDMLDRQLEVLQREHNMFAAQFETISGVPGVVPRYPPKPPRTVVRGDMTLNHIHISHSSVGVLNIGTIGTLDGAVGLMRNSGSQEAAQAFKAITEAVAEAQDLIPSAKNKILEILSVLAAEGAAPQERRRKEVMRILLRDVAAALSASMALARLWETLRPAIEGLF